MGWRGGTTEHHSHVLSECIFTEKGLGVGFTVIFPMWETLLGWYIPSQQRWRGYRNAAGVRLCVCQSRFALWTRYRLQFLPIYFQTSHVSCWWWEEEHYWFWIAGSKVKVIFGTFPVKSCGRATDFSFLLNHFQTSRESCWWWDEKLYWFLVKGQGHNWHFFVDKIQTTVLAQSLSNFICKLLAHMRFSAEDLMLYPRHQCLGSRRHPHAKC